LEVSLAARNWEHRRIERISTQLSKEEVASEELHSRIPTLTLTLDLNCCKVESEELHSRIAKNLMHEAKYVEQRSRIESDLAACGINLESRLPKSDQDPDDTLTSEIKAHKTAIIRLNEAESSVQKWKREEYNAPMGTNANPNPNLNGRHLVLQLVLKGITRQSASRRLSHIPQRHLTLTLTLTLIGG